MINHIVLMKFKPEATEEQIAELQASLDDLPNRIFEIQMYEFGRNLAECGGSYDFGLVALFANPGTLKRYENHPEHLALKKTLDHLCQAVVSVNFEGTDAGSMKEPIPDAPLPPVR